MPHFLSRTVEPPSLFWRIHTQVGTGIGKGTDKLELRRHHSSAKWREPFLVHHVRVSASATKHACGLPSRRSAGHAALRKGHGSVTMNHPAYPQ